MSKITKPKAEQGAAISALIAAPSPAKSRKTLKKAKKPKASKVAKVPKVVVSVSRFKRLVVPRPDVLHGYLRHSEINQYLDYIERRYSNFVKVHTLGVTHERRHVRGIEVNWNCPKNLLALQAQRRRPMGAPKTMIVQVPDVRNIVFIEGGTHAREWITISVALNCIYQLTEKNVRNRDVLRNLRFFIVPLTNPDGYEYTMSKNRTWRKNRRPSSNAKCIGTDCNRNYDFQWEHGASKASRNTYKGDKPFSEPETRAIRNVLQKMGKNLLFLLSLHSYAQSIMFPWGYTREMPVNWQQLQTIAHAGRNAIKSYSGRLYRTGSIANLSKHTITGSIVDYAYGHLKVPLALVMELPSSDYGFQPPPETISPLGYESWYGIREMCRHAFSMMPAFADYDGSQISRRLEIGCGDRNVTTGPTCGFNPVPIVPTLSYLYPCAESDENEVPIPAKGTPVAPRATRK